MAEEAQVQAQENGPTQQGAFTNPETRYNDGKLAPQCPAAGANPTIAIDRLRYRRHREYVTYHYHHAP